MLTILLIALQLILVISLLAGSILLIRYGLKGQSRNSDHGSAYAGVLLFLASTVALLGGRFKAVGAEFESKSIIELWGAVQKGDDLSRLTDDKVAGLRSWGEMAVNRIVVRNLLESICELAKSDTRCDPANPNPEFKMVLEATGGFLSRTDFEMIDRFRTETHFAEWGRGVAPTPSQIDETHSDAPKIIALLEKIKEQQESQRLGLHH